jgi:putative colanic acid biosynthesis acetyltransferase WcaF
MISEHNGDKIAAERFLLDASKSGRMGPSFSFRNRAERALFVIIWSLLASWTPPPLHRWRCFVLRIFGAKIGRNVRFYGSAIVWHPAFLVIQDFSIIGPRVRLYNQGEITIGARTVISQGAHLCASTHDPKDPFFQLLLKPISVGNDVWVAADTFVGPGVTIGDGAVLGARGSAFSDLASWTIYGGNPAKVLKRRVMFPEQVIGDG